MVFSTLSVFGLAKVSHPSNYWTPVSSCDRGLSTVTLTLELDKQNAKY